MSFPGNAFRFQSEGCASSYADYAMRLFSSNVLCGCNAFPTALPLVTEALSSFMEIPTRLRKSLNYLLADIDQRVVDHMAVSEFYMTLTLVDSVQGCA